MARAGVPTPHQRRTTGRAPSGPENEPPIQASNGRSFQPFTIVFVPMVDPSKRLPSRNGVVTHLNVPGYPTAPKPDAGQAAGSHAKP